MTRMTGVEDRVEEANADGASERGAIAVFVALMVPVVLIFTAFAVDVSRWYVEMQRLQKTVDAAALAAAPFMPEKIDKATKADKASKAAIDLVNRNGYVGSTAVIDDAGLRPTQVRVSLSYVVPNAFASLIGIPSTTITRTAVGEFSGPAPLGSPCNVHGNEPWVSGSSQGSALPSPLPSNCSNFPQFWSTVVGPEVHKTQGDQFGARKCGASESGCSGTTNLEYDQRGYVITIRVREPVTGSLPIQLYDPAYVDTESDCGALPNITTPTLVGNTYVDDADNRYEQNSVAISATKPSYCTGDNDNSGLRFGDETATVTSFGMIKPTDTLNPFDATANLPANQIAGCAAQYPGWSKAGGNDGSWSTPHNHSGVKIATGTATQQLSNDSEFTRLFHRWSTLCSIPADPVTNQVPVGDYYLRVRTNVPFGTASNVFSYTDDPANPGELGNGSNRFAVRAVPVSTADRAKVSVSPYSRMPIFANAPGSVSVFNLIRVLPGNAGQVINFTFYDVGDASDGAILSVLTPDLSPATGCTKEGKENGADPDCSISGIKNTNGWNGQFQRMRIPIPKGYDCDANNNGVRDTYECWWQLKVDFPGATSVTDQTTWTAVVEGDPVRLVE